MRRIGIGHERAGYGHEQFHRNFRLMGSALLDVRGPKYGVFLAPDQADVSVGRRQQSRRHMAPVEVREVVVGVGNKLT